MSAINIMSNSLIEIYITKNHEKKARNSLKDMNIISSDYMKGREAYINFIQFISNFQILQNSRFV